MTVGIGTNAGGGTLGGTPTATASSGVATFSGLSINKAGTGYTLTASASGPTGTTSNAFNITAGGASQLVWTQQPSAVVSGVSMTPAVTVTVEDASGNVVTGASGTVTLTLTTPAGAILTGGGATGVSGGVATFSGLSVDKVGTYTLTPSDEHRAAWHAAGVQQLHRELGRGVGGTEHGERARGDGGERDDGDDHRA